MNQSFFLIVILSVFLLSCSTETPSSKSKEENKTLFEENKKIATMSDSIVFDRGLVNLNDSVILSLYDSLKNKFDVEFSLIDLQTLFKKVEFEQITQGKKFSHKFLIEDFKCDCFDEMTLSFDHTDEYFTLVLFETIYVQDLDWCPEHNKWFVFKFKDSKIFDLDLIAEAG